MVSEALDIVRIEEDVRKMSRGAVVRDASPGRSARQRRFLRGLGHALKPTAMVGHNGLTEAFVASLESLVEQHELVKVKLLENAPCTPEAAALWIHRVTGADVVQVLGRTLLVYRARAKDPEIRLPAP